MKKCVSIVLCLVLCMGLFSGCSRFATAGKPNLSNQQTNTDGITLNVYNWGQYMARGEDGAMDVIAAFEEEYPDIHINYTTYDTNETMYTKLKAGGISVDVIFPSDYMIGRMIGDNMLLPIDFENIPNYQYIDEAYKNTSYDPENKYSIPYTWGTVGIIYNTKYVDPADAVGWELLWNEKYEDKILMFGNSRDAFGIAELMKGYSLDTTEDERLQECAELLKAQRPVVQQYVMDEIFDLMENEEAWIAPYYAGDYITMAGENDALAFYHPTQGFNLFIDAMCIPSTCQNKEAAETFINFLCRPDIAGANMEWIGYGTPETAAREYLPTEVAENPAAYPDEETLKRGQGFSMLPPQVTQHLEDLWLWAKTSK